MRLKPTPLVETSLVFSIAWLISLVLSVFATNDFNAALGMASGIAILYLMLSYTIWAVAGAIFRSKSHRIRFFVNLTITSLISIAVPIFVDAQLKSEALTRSYILMSLIYFFASGIAAGLTYFLLTRPKKQRD
ncbi:MAG: hypothetical protein KGL41_05510 [Actinomycetales bacterium]|nr:hypothetical protein [Actinomycetales bacterium]